MPQTWLVLQTLHWSLKGENEILIVRQSSPSGLPAREKQTISERVERIVGKQVLFSWSQGIAEHRTSERKSINITMQEKN